MDPNHFDRLTRALTVTPSRRGIARSLAGLALAGVLAPLLGLAGAEQAEAKNKKKNGKKKKKRTCKPSCIAPMTCQRGRCACPSRTVLCNGECYANCNPGLTFDPVNCNCCQINGASGCLSSQGSSCCSRTCRIIDGTCTGRIDGDTCDFSAQCANGFCSGAGVCGR